MRDGRIQKKNVKRVTMPTLPQHGVFWETAVSDLSRALFAQSIVGHSGSDPDASTFMYFSPETEGGAVILLNSDIHAAEEAGISIFCAKFWVWRNKTYCLLLGFR